MATKDVKDTKPKLPAQQLAILAVVRFSEPMAYTSVFPYLPEMIRSFGIEQNNIARWAGLTSAVFSIAQSVTAVPWGRAADRWGRKPILIVGLLSTMVCFVIWGMSTSLPMAVIVRAIQGGGNGNVGIIRTMVAELVPEKELQPRAFSIMPLVWSLGSVIGPSFGGFFAEPAKQYPEIFGNWEYFKRFPFVLPNLIATIFFLISVACASLFLQETLPTKREEKDWGLEVGKRVTRAFQRRPTPSHRRRSFVDGEATAPLVASNVASKPQTTKRYTSAGMKEVFTSQTVINLLAYTFMAFHSVAFDQNVPVFLNYPKMEDTDEVTKLPFYYTGGFGLSTGQIGTIFTCYGITCGLIQFIAYPPLVARFGVLRCFKACSLMLPITYFLTPYTALFTTPGGRYAALATVMFFKALGVIVAFPSTTILLTNSCTSVRVLGTLNGFATAFSGVGRALGPALAGIAFTWGVDHGYILTPYAFLAVVALIGAIPVFMIIEGDGPTETPEESDSEEDAVGDSATMAANDSAIEERSEGDEQVPLLRDGDEGGSRYNAISSGSK